MQLFNTHANLESTTNVTGLCLTDDIFEPDARTQVLNKMTDPRTLPSIQLQLKYRTVNSACPGLLLGFVCGLLGFFVLTLLPRKLEVEAHAPCFLAFIALHVT